MHEASKIAFQADDIIELTMGDRDLDGPHTLRESISGGRLCVVFFGGSLDPGTLIPVSGIGDEAWKFRPDLMRLRIEERRRELARLEARLAQIEAPAPARTEREAASSRRPSLIGICHVWIRDVKITGYAARPNEHIPPGTAGDLEVLEIDKDGRVIHGNFHPGGCGRGYGAVLLPEWEHVLSPGSSR